MTILRTNKWLVASVFCSLTFTALAGCSEDTPATVDNENPVAEDDAVIPEEDEESNEEEEEEEVDAGRPRDAGRVDAGRVDAGRVDAGKTDPVLPKPPDAGLASSEAGAATGDAGSLDSAVPVTREDRGMGDGKDVITIGDSWMLLSAGTGIEVSLEKVSKRDYRNFGVPGTKMLDEVIPRQYTMAKAQGPVKTVVMTGGGNDIIQVLPIDCADSAFGDVCKAQIDKVAARLLKLWQEMSADGVEDMIMVGYTRKASILLSPLSKSAEYSYATIPPLCEMVPPPMRCHSIDADEVFDGATREGIHPTNAGYDKIGAAVWDVMQKEGVRR